MFNFIFVMLLSQSPIAQAQKLTVEQDLAIQGYSYLEILPYAEMHLAHGMGFQTKIFYSNAVFTKFNSIGRPVEYVRRQEGDFNGYHYLFELTGTFSYDSDPTILLGFSASGRQERTPIDEQGNGKGETISSVLYSEFKILSMGDDQFVAQLYSETRLDDKNGELLEYNRSEKPVTFYFKNRSIYKAMLEGKTEYLRGYWKIEADLKNQVYEFKTPCRRITATVPEVSITYNNPETKETKTWVTSLSVDSKGLKTTLAEPDAKYDLKECYPW